MVVVEDGVRAGGVGSAVAQALRDDDVVIPVREVGVAPGWYPHGSRNEILADLGLTAPDIARDIIGWMSKLDDAGETATGTATGHRSTAGRL